MERTHVRCYVIKISTRSLRGCGTNDLDRSASLVSRGPINSASIRCCCFNSTMTSGDGGADLFRHDRRFVAHRKIHGKNQNPDRRQPGPGLRMRPEDGSRAVGVRWLGGDDGGVTQCRMTDGSPFARCRQNFLTPLGGNLPQRLAAQTFRSNCSVSSFIILPSSFPRKVGRSRSRNLSRP